MSTPDDPALTPAAFLARAQQALEHAEADMQALAATDPQTARALAGRWATRLALGFRWEQK